jgi:FlaA1/EpsC-like NDP-sugar epimerase
LGRIADVGHYAQQHQVRRAYVAMPNVSGAAMRLIVEQLTDAGLGIRVLGAMEPFLGSKTLASRLREVSIDDLLRRDPIRLDAEAIRAFLADKRVLVTGAAGSIGSELCRQVMRFGPSCLVALDCAESPLYDLMMEFPHRVVAELVDVTDRMAVGRVFERHKPQVVFHAAAVKHVPMLEEHPARAIQVNVVGTRIVAEAACGHAEAFVMISTDKAVRPTSVMGASKRVAERVVRGFADAPGGTRFVSVRFGNVLGSNGSVVPIFKRQIAHGGPVTVTHPEMRRYFITIPEAVQLLLQAATLGKGGEVFVLDMGQQVRIVDLAEDIIRLSGLRPGKDVKIEFTGVRPGEKLYEEWATDSETHAPTIHPAVFRLLSPDAGLHSVEALEAVESRRPVIVAALGALVEDYAPLPASPPLPDGSVALALPERGPCDGPLRPRYGPAGGHGAFVERRRAGRRSWTRSLN